MKVFYQTEAPTPQKRPSTKTFASSLATSQRWDFLIHRVSYTARSTSHFKCYNTRTPARTIWIVVLAQRPIILVLMMINSCSYSLLMILYLFSFSYLSRSQQVCSFNKGVLELTRVDSRACASRSHLALGWSLTRWIVFGSSRLGDRVLQEGFGLCCLDLV